jgi:hypothetical protein
LAGVLIKDISSEGAGVVDVEKAELEEIGSYARGTSGGWTGNGLDGDLSGAERVVDDDWAGLGMSAELRLLALDFLESCLADSAARPAVQRELFGQEMEIRRGDPAQAGIHVRCQT